jgi:NAD(P)-dependent dehydrogenase (short-subunit alcohol dehydrogenase family)
LHLEIAELSSLEEVRQLGSRLRSEFPKVDLLVNNAGVYCARRHLTEDGFERTFAVNHLSHFLLTHLLWPSLVGAGGRVINVSSEGHKSARLTRAPLEEIIRGRGRYNGWRAYGDSKLANILFTVELGRRCRPGDLSAVAVHPGVLATRIWNSNANPLSLLMRLFKPLMGKPSVGGDAVVFLAQEASATVHGRYFAKKRRSEPAPAALDRGLAKNLWNVSRELVGLSDEDVPERNRDD